ncbi:hypothetical protein [Aureispira sp. CCB-E]|uniref:hypothetical protein n=1 Tax=Aureispira sp. CCB-E TaxID=3051121 RepID=UPI0028686BB4|nr:hypothetical protein [Aureispira sp. CCB-E]WMX17116.1 hypothetical protein QP953_12100 [Aureispira sp. CCB-E]
MNKESASALGWGLVALPLYLYGLKNKMGWRYWLTAALIIAPIGGVIGHALGKEDKEAKALQNQAQKHALEQNAIEVCRERECKDKGGFYFNGQCQGDPIVTSYGQILGTNYHDLNC